MFQNDFSAAGGDSKGIKVLHLDMGRPVRRLLQYPVEGDLDWKKMESNGLIQEIFKR